MTMDDYDFFFQANNNTKEMDKLTMKNKEFWIISLIKFQLRLQAAAPRRRYGNEMADVLLAVTCYCTIRGFKVRENLTFTERSKRASKLNLNMLFLVGWDMLYAIKFEDMTTRWMDGYCWKRGRSLPLATHSSSKASGSGQQQ